MLNKRIFQILVMTLGVLCFAHLAMASSSGGGEGKADEKVAAPMQTYSSRAISKSAKTVSKVASLQAMVAKITQLEQSGTCEDDPKCLRQVLDLLKEINAQADQIEAEIPEAKTQLKSPGMSAKMDKLAKYVSTLRSQAKKSAAFAM